MDNERVFHAERRLKRRRCLFETAKKEAKENEVTEEEPSPGYLAGGCDILHQQGLLLRLWQVLYLPVNAILVVMLPFLTLVAWMLLLLRMRLRLRSRYHILRRWGLECTLHMWRCEKKPRSSPSCPGLNQRGSGQAESSVFRFSVLKR